MQSFALGVWVVEPTHRWINRFTSLLIRRPKKASNYLDLVYRVCGVITWRSATPARTGSKSNANYAGNPDCRPKNTKVRLFEVAISSYFVSALPIGVQHQNVRPTLRGDGPGSTALRQV
jgi:hypothetical protein